MGEPSKRLFVGNLFPEVANQDLQKRFEKFGKIDNIEIKTKKDIDGKVVSTFAFVDLNVSDRGLADCISTFTNTKWKSHVIMLQQAKESFMDRLAKERKEKEAKFKTTSQEDLKYDPIQMVKNKDQVDVNSSNMEEIPKEKKKKRKSLGADVPEVTIESKYSYTPLNMLKKRNLEDGGIETGKEDLDQQNVDEGTIQNGLVHFDGEEEVSPAKVVKQATYNSDSEGEGEKEEKIKVPLTKEEKAERKIVNKEKKKKAMERVDKREHRLTESIKPVQGVKPGSLPRKRYYSSSSDEEAAQTDAPQRKTGDDVMKTFQSFSKFWNDDEEEAEEENKTKNAVDNVGILNTLREQQKPVIEEKIKKIKLDKKEPTKQFNEDSKQEKRLPKAKGREVQSKKISDDRFKMDSRFCDKSDDDIDDDYELENQVDLPNDDANERSRNIDILSTMFDKDLNKEEKVRRKPSMFKDSSLLRFDPDQEDHVKFIRKAADKEMEETEEKTDLPEEEDEVKEDKNAAPEPSKERYFEVSKNIKETFAKKNTSSLGGFSFGFGQNVDKDKEPTSFSLLSVHGKEMNQKKSSNDSSNPFKCDSDDEGAMEDTTADSNEMEASKFGLQLKGKGKSGLQESFFFKKGDARLEEGLNFFFKQEVDFDALRVAFNAQRPLLSAILKKKMRQKAKRNEKMRFGGGKKKESGYKGGKRNFKNKK